MTWGFVFCSPCVGRGLWAVQCVGGCGQVQPFSRGWPSPSGAIYSDRGFGADAEVWAGQPGSLALNYRARTVIFTLGIYKWKFFPRAEYSRVTQQVGNRGCEGDCIKFCSYNMISLLIMKCNQAGIWHLCELKVQSNVFAHPICSAAERKSQSWFLSLTSREPNGFRSFIKLDCRMLRTLVWSSVINYKPRCWISKAQLGVYW